MSHKMPPLRVAYILLYFPRLTETFVADEIGALQAQNIQVEIISLLPPQDDFVQPLSQTLLQFTWNAPALWRWQLWKAQFYFIFHAPLLYFSLWFTLINQPSPKQPLVSFFKRFVVFLKAVSAAYHLKETKVDLLHAHFAWLPGAAAWVCARLLKKPFTVTVHAYDLFSYKNDLLPLISREADHIVAISQFNSLLVAAVRGCPPEKISVIHCGVDLAQFAPKPRLGAEPPHQTPLLKILSVGSLVAKKGHSDLIAACQLLSQSGIQYTCSIIGGGPEEPILRAQIAALGLQSRVKLLGARPQPEIRMTCNQYDLFVLAARVTPEGDMDGIPVVLMEAAAAGLPLVSTFVSGIPELVQHQQTGFLVQPNDPSALANAILALAADPSQRARLGQNARDLVEAQFSLQKSSLQLLALFYKVCRAS